MVLAGFELGTLRSLCWHQGHCDLYAGIRDIAISMLASGTLRSLCWHQEHCDLYAGILLQGHCDLYAGILLQGHCDLYAGIRDIAISMLASGTLRSLCWHPTTGALRFSMLASYY
ncbi:hypothetical protein DPMN_098777 [Dreissena polymorpha]|uniref:Uncharacterized protein n=1 Tax=Dreissena polymorpha TaxID=45954 RepID=A0A9D4LEA2_DREPO|nr:hypothetical protein DPMN_098777 [Dreissena polymorpha]